MWPGGTTLEVGRLPAGSSINYVEVWFKESDPEQPVVIRRLILGRNTEPFVIRIKTGHCLQRFGD